VSPGRQDRLVPRITAHASAGEVSLEPGARSQSAWTADAKGALIRRGYELTVREVEAHAQAAA
jgi:hypothetical protein